MSDAYIEIKNVSRKFTRKPSLLEKGAIAAGVAKAPPVVHALDGVNLEIKRGQVLGLVGESGCGKSTLGRVVCGLIEPSEGEVLYGGKRLDALSPADRRAMQLRVQMIFQDPSSSLNPRQRVSDIVGAAPLYHGMTTRRNLPQYLDEQLSRAGLDPASKTRFPHQFSGGQRQRIGIARALAVQPEVLVCDESVASLDVSIQAQILNLFLDLKEELNLTYLFISHDLSVVKHISDRVAVMYLGRVVEEADVGDLFSKPQHPYTRALLAEIPSLEAKPRTFSAIKGEIPSPLNPPTGCHFHPRCPYAIEKCSQQVPPLKTVAPGHKSACHLNG